MWKYFVKVSPSHKRQRQLSPWRLLVKKNLYHLPRLKYFIFEGKVYVELLQPCFLLSLGPLEVCEYLPIFHPCCVEVLYGLTERNQFYCLPFAFDTPVTLFDEAEWVGLVYVSCTLCPWLKYASTFSDLGVPSHSSLPSSGMQILFFPGYIFIVLQCVVQPCVIGL